MNEQNPQDSRGLTVKAVMAVFLGGAVGAMLREAVTTWQPAFPWFTLSLVANVAACFVLGGLIAAQQRIGLHMFLLTAVGFCGGLSTFSTFAAEIYRLIHEGDHVRSVSAPAIELITGIAAAVTGEAVARSALPIEDGERNE